MKLSLLFSCIIAVVTAAPIEEKTDESDSEIVFSTIYTNSPTTAPTSASTVDKKSIAVPVTSTASAVNHVDLNAVSTTATSVAPFSAKSSLSMLSSSLISVPNSTSSGASTNAYDRPGFPSNGQHLSAPASTAEVPAGAALYTPPNSDSFGKPSPLRWTNKKPGYPPNGSELLLVRATTPLPTSSPSASAPAAGPSTSAASPLSSRSRRTIQRQVNVFISSNPRISQS